MRGILQSVWNYRYFIFSSIRTSFQSRFARSKLGGLPDWDQDEDAPICPHCKQEMVFVGQLDSIEHDEAHNPHRKNSIDGDQHYMFGDVGLMFIFICFACQESISIVQSG